MAPVHLVVSSARHDHAKGVKCLAVAWTEAAQKHQYDSPKTRKKLSDLVQQHFHGHKPYEWQLDTAEALLLGLDSIIIAGTGTGKTLPFVIPLLYNKAGRIIIISPLKALQQDQVIHMQKNQILTYTCLNRNTDFRKLVFLPSMSMVRHGTLSSDK